jgi:hypothetical protein
VVFVITWVFPFSFMISMGSGCDSSTRALGRRALTFYATDAGSAQAAIATARQQRQAGLNRRQIRRAMLVFLSVAIPITFIAVIVEEHRTIGITPPDGCYCRRGHSSPSASCSRAGVVRAAIGVGMSGGC